jgi:putative membrane protein
MINRVIATTAALGLALGVASSVSAQSEAQRPTGTNKQDRNVPGAGQRERIPQRATQQDDQEFIKAASAGNNFEIQPSQYVQQRSQDQEVKELAQKLAEDHQQAQQQLREVAQQSGVTLEDRLMPAQQAKLEEFQKKQGPELDRAFIFCNVGDHHKGIMEYSWAARNAQNSQLKQYCEQTLPHLQEHLRRVDQVASSVLGINEAQTASERIRGEGQSSTPTTPGSITPGSSGQGNQGTPGNTGERAPGSGR